VPYEPQLGCIYGSVLFVVVEGHDQIRGYYYWREDNIITQLILHEENCVDGCLGVETRNSGIALADGPSDLKGGGDPLGRRPS
jgi:hypothetical protein